MNGQTNERANEFKLAGEITNYSIDCRAAVDAATIPSDDLRLARGKFIGTYGITREADGTVFLAGGGKRAECAAP